MRDQVFLNIAKELAALGTCDRKRVGAVITRSGRAVSWGYNGAPPGLPHCSENNHGYANMPHDVDHPPEVMALAGCRNSTHAEANAVCFASRQGISTDGGTLYVTVSPCEVCARLLIAAGIVRVVYAEEYRDRRGIEILTEAGIPCGNGGSDDWSYRPEAGPGSLH
jgi:dCMP deaminase